MRQKVKGSCRCESSESSRNTGGTCRRGLLARCYLLGSNRVELA
jgi:hypothetical protein